MIIKTEIKNANFEGHAEIDMPKFKDRMDLVKQVSLEGNELSSNITQASKLVDLAYEKTKSLKLKHKSGKEFNSIEELEVYKDGIEAIYLIGSYVINGIPLGND
jgi:hypothetical protein